MNLYKVIGLVVSVAVLASCAMGARETPAPVVEGTGAPPPAILEASPGDSEVQVYAYSRPAGETEAADSPVYTLMEQSQQQRAAGDLTGAASTLERALRIQPRDPHLWNRLARIRLEQGQAIQAKELATKSNALAMGKNDLQGDNWGIIAAALRRDGDNAGAREAERKADALR